MKYTPLSWEKGEVCFLDQRKLPHQEEYISCRTLDDCYRAIADMVVRGAPLIGVTAMWGLTLWLKNHPYASWKEWEKACQQLSTARPTAVNLFYAIEKIHDKVFNYYNNKKTFDGLYEEMISLIGKEVDAIQKDHQAIADYGAAEMERLYGNRPLRLATLCNTGALACGPMGTALGIISHLHSLERVEIVYAFETRPWLQGSRLTAYELSKENIPHRIIVDSASSWLMREKSPDAIFVGADRIASNGDTANKIGTSSLAIVAQHYNIPFYVAAPLSSFDKNLETGQGIPIELRGEEEVLYCAGSAIAPDKSRALNPGFDITENNLITALFCEKGMIFPVQKNEVESVLV